MSNLEYQANQGASLWQNNPVLVQLLGLSPVLAVSNTVVNGLGLGVATAIVLILSCVTASLARKYISYTWRFVWYLLIMASYTTILEFLMRAYYFPLYQELGIYVPLICCNFAILIRMEIQSSMLNWKLTARDSALVAAGFLLAIVLLATLREFVATGSVLNDWQLLLATPWLPEVNQSATTGSVIFSFANLQPAALILLGLIVAAKNMLDSRFGFGSTAEKETVKPVTRARVTGSL